MWALALIPAALVIFLAVLVIRAAAFKPKAQPELDDYEVRVAKEKAAADLSELVRCKTVSYRDPTLEDEMRITIIATGFDRVKAAEAAEQAMAKSRPAEPVAELSLK